MQERPANQVLPVVDPLQPLHAQGRRLLRQWFLRPVVQLDVIADRHDTLELLVAAHTTNDALRTGMRKVRQGWIGCSHVNSRVTSQEVLKREFFFVLWTSSMHN